MNRRGLGTAALALGIIAVLIMAAAALVPTVAFSGPSSSSGIPTDQQYGAAGVVFVIDAALFVVGVPVALLAVILGIVAAVRRRGRLLGVIGAVLGLVPIVALLGWIVVMAVSTVAA